MPSYKPPFISRFALLFSVFVLAVFPCAGAESPKFSFDVPANTLENAVKTLSRQSGVDVIFPTKIARGVRTKVVKGEYTVREALEIMLESTGFVVEQDEKTGAFTVLRKKAGQGAKKNELHADAPRRNEYGAEPATVTITGRVFNVATGYYLKNAEVRHEGTENMVYTEDGGSYTITVPAGTVTLTASYTSVQPAAVTIDAIPGGRNTADFELQPLVIGRPALVGTATTSVPMESEIVVLDRFVVTSERAGQAKAIMTQRAADNAVTAIATDNFGELTQGSVGEFLKYMPGVTLDYDEDEATTVRVGGLDPKYVGFSLDGIALSSASSSRANFFAQMAITGIESIEFNQTLLARMPANTPAGKFELKSRYAFDRKRPQLSYSLGLDGMSDAIELGRSYLPDDRKHYRTYPGGQISWGGPFFNRRLGIDLSLSRYASYRNNQIQRTYYNYLVPDSELNPATNFVERNGNLEMEEGPIIRQLSWRDGPRLWASSAANLSVDYRITPNLTLSLRNQFTLTENRFYNIYIYATASEKIVASDHYTGPPQSISPDSTLTKWIVDPVNPVSTNTVIQQFNGYGVTETTTWLVSPRLEYKKGPFQANLRAARSYSRSNTSDIENGAFRATVNRITGVGFIAERPSTDSPEWTLTQTAGTEWSEPQNWGRTQTYGYGIISVEPSNVENIQDSAYLDLTCALPILGHPVTLRGGGGILNSDYSYRSTQRRFNYVGPENYQMANPIPYNQNYTFDFDLGGKGGNIDDQGWRVDDQKTLYSIYQEHPEWFVEDVTNNFRREFLNTRDLVERIDAAYVEATSRAGRFSFNAGLRFERTDIEVMTTRMRPWEDIDAARELASPETIATGIFDYTTDGEGNRSMVSNAGFLYQYYDGQRFPRKTDYDNLFFSGGLKYDFAKNLRLQLSASQSILRPDYYNLAGTVQYSSYNSTNVWVPNPTLKPEETTKYYAGLQWYLNPAGYLGLSAYRLDIDGLQISNMQISAEQAEAQLGYPLRSSLITGGEGGGLDEGEFINPAAVYYRSTINAEGVRTVYGATLEYNQQLTFLPGYLKGLSVFGSITASSLKNAEIDEEKIGRASTSANGGIRYRLGRFNIQLRATWQDDSLYSVTRPLVGRAGYPSEGRRWFGEDHVYRKARTIVDLSGGFTVHPHIELVFSVRNITNSPAIFYSNVPERLHQYQVYGSIWNLSLKGTF